jgi:thiol:disulfide interchange protein
MLREAGANIGWGFQLQSPPVVVSFALLMLVVGLNLSGVFDIGASAQNGAYAATGAFGTGLVAVALAAPCTAPFMAAAMGWAVAQPTPIALLVFAALACGFALPLTALSFSPFLVRLLPRPGPWMEHLRGALAFPMYGAAAWLTWVFALQTRLEGLPPFFASALTLSMAAWLVGRAQRSTTPRGWSVAAFASMFGALSMAYASASGSPEEAISIRAQPWTFSAQQRLLARHEPVFIEFTAAWCVTCQVNDATVLNTLRVRQALRNAHVAYLRADWTRPDQHMLSALNAHGRAGVPLYLVYGASGNAVALPQILDERTVLDAIQAAQTH